MKICDVTLNKEKLILDVACIATVPLDVTFVISDLKLDCTYYIWDVNLSPSSSVWISPLPNNLIAAVKNSDTFTGFRCKIYHNKKLIQCDELPYNGPVNMDTVPFISTEFDVVGHSYLDFFHSDLCNDIDLTGTVVDAGANVGFFTLLALQNGASKVYSIEPDVSAFFCLQKNFRRNPSVVLIQKALSAVKGTTEFYYAESNVANSMIKPTTVYMSDVVNTIDLQTIFDIESYINLIKLDIEGSEFEVIQTLPRELYDRVNQFFIEFHGSPTPIERHLKDIGYLVEYRHSSPTDTAGFIYAKRDNR
jgi:FkbM family methyltransferase